MAINGVFNVNQMANQIANALRDYSNVTREQVNEIAELIAKRGVVKLRTAGSFKDISGDYRKGWRAKKVGNKWVVHNATDYQLTHLLEKGHAKVGGGRSQTFPHIKPVEQELIEEFEQEIRGVLGQ